MFRYKIFLFNMENNEIKCREYKARLFELHNNSIIIYPIDFEEPAHIHFNNDMRLEIIPYSYLLELE